MKLIVARTAALMLLGTAPAEAHEVDPAQQRVTGAAQPREPTGRPGADAPKVDPKLVIDVLNLLTQPRQPAPPPPAILQPVEPAAPVIGTPAPEPPASAIPPPPRSRPVASPAPATAVPLNPRPAPPSAATPPPNPAAPAEPASTGAVAEEIPPPMPAPVEAVTPVATPPEPVPRAASPEPTAVPASQRSASMLESRWLLLALLAAAATIAGAAAWNRARRLARTRAALSLEPRLDLSDGTCSLEGLALAGPPVSIRTRLEFAGG